MRAEQFIREYGVENVKTLIEDYEKDQFAFKSFDPAADCCFDAGLCMGQEKAWWDICIYDLKRLVESVELISLFGSIKIAKDKVKMADFNGFLLVSVPIENGLADVYIHKVEQAIRDHESIYGEEQ
ncbi:hypothetical protein N3K59_18375 [Acinetobacter baumannii]|uniref:hypothetical protein n=1 Tax=Acinetobacter baumannii TaxID=470 RepID=UPI0021A4AEB0|nr:hypothetical protein [Acinetobacter baumannii]MCT2603036.1 hypothetical protein [Acinetobacter baumannii]HAV5443957.1 hypothetical protein [Acinetobacter baumannii]